MDKQYDSEMNLTLLTDFYELTMANGYFQNGFKDTIAYFDMFYRNTPDNGGFVIMAGVEQMVDYLKKLHFTEEDIAYLRGRGFDEGFLSYLRDFHFSCDVWAVPEGTPIFPGEPIVKVHGPVIQAQFIETMVLLLINHQSLIATKANRIVRAAEGRGVMEFGSRRAHGTDAAINGARAAYIGGCVGTACTIDGRDYGIPALGTMAHSWIQLFDTELDAFKAYAREYPDACTLLVDTYNVLKSGVPNAIRTFDEVLKPMGKRPAGIRIDSGDIVYLSKQARKMLDDAGYPDCQIVASNSLDEYLIGTMLDQGACLDSFGVGERMITSSGSPVLDGVYKLSAIERDGEIIPKIKVSENVTKITNPGAKCVYRLYDKDTGKAEADVITLQDETIDPDKPYLLFDPEYTWKQKTIENFTVRPLLEPVFEGGKCVFQKRPLQEIRSYCLSQVDDTLWDEVKRFEHPHNYYVDLSRKLWDLKYQLLKEHSQKS
ncbi:MAG: nicotinate phosphoribosyltransferase [Acutalibacteraceae bacterium]|nr:nicotinate phosphoribosyltransferase [Acutalibacteraceae bacterium]